MPRLTIWLFALVTAAFAVGVNALVEYLVGFDISWFSLAVAIPVGTMALVALGLTGFLYGAGRYAYTPDPVDLGFLMCLAFAIPIAIYGYQYLLETRLLESAQRPAFGTFISQKIMNTMISIHGHGMPHDAPPVRAGGIGLLSAMIKLGAMPAIAKVVHSVAETWARQREG